jgi:hypothetical protein
MTSAIRALLLSEAAAFALAALVHAGVLVRGYEHPAARTAETILAGVLVAGLALGWARPGLARRSALGAQGVALAGTLVGVFTIIVGVGPRSVPDVVYHLIMIGLLGWGLLVTARPAAPLE